MALCYNARLGFACRSALPPSPKIALKKSTAVFVGKVLKVEQYRDYQGVKFLKATCRVDRFWKGITANTIVVITPASSSACGFMFAKGQRYLVYANWQASPTGLRTTTRTRTADLSEAKKDLDSLGVGRVPTHRNAAFK